MKTIDFVITWVDGSDDAWLANRQKHSYIPINTAQYRDWDILKYLFRSIEVYAPWVNKIYFVTEGHVPHFLVSEHDKVVFVKHEDFIPKEYLPVFSSHPIELNLHRIEGLSETFVYFNDDTFLNAPVSKEDFFYQGLPRDLAVINPVAPSYYNSVANIMVNNIGLINSHYKKNNVIQKNPLKWFNYRYGMLNLLNLMFLPWGRFLGLYQSHMASSMTKTMYRKVWELFPEQMILSSSHNVRNNFEDVNQWLIKEVQICEGAFFPQTKNFGKYMMIKNDADVRVLLATLKTKKHKMICVNDHVDEDHFDRIGALVKEGFQMKFSKKSTFEK